MEIRYLGDQSIFIKGKKENVIINPSEENFGSKKYPSRIVVLTSKNLDNFGLGNEEVIIRGPGEYEIGGVEVNGINGSNGNTVYIVGVDGVRVGFVGELDEALSDKRIEKVDNVDILVANCIENKSINNKMIIDWAKKWGANYLIPIAWDKDESALVKFLDAADAEGQEQVESFKIEKESLPEGMEVVVLKKV